MNKSDIKLIIILLLIVLGTIIYLNINKKEGTKAFVYYKDEIVKEIDLNINNTYTVKGELGDVVIEVKNNKLHIIKENSPKHICSKMGYINNNNETLVCLPNKIIVKIEDKKNKDLDGVVY